MLEDGKVVERWTTWDGVLSGGWVATMWDGEISGMERALKPTRGDKKILFLSDSQAVIAAVQKAERKGKAGTESLKQIINLIRTGNNHWGRGKGVRVGEGLCGHRWE